MFFHQIYLKSCLLAKQASWAHTRGFNTRPSALTMMPHENTNFAAPERNKNIPTTQFDHRGAEFHIRFFDYCAFTRNFSTTKIFERFKTRKSVILSIRVEKLHFLEHAKRFSNRNTPEPQEGPASAGRQPLPPLKKHPFFRSFCVLPRGTEGIFGPHQGREGGLV